MIILTMFNQSWELQYQWRIQEEAVIYCISCMHSVWLVRLFVHIELWKIAYIRSSSEAHWHQGSCRRDGRCTHFMSLIFFLVWNEYTQVCPAAAEGQCPAGSIIPRQPPAARSTQSQDFIPFCHFTKWDNEEGGNIAQSALHPPVLYSRY